MPYKASGVYVMVKKKVNGKWRWVPFKKRDSHSEAVKLAAKLNINVKD
jgi:hypothetical protein